MELTCGRAELYACIDVLHGCLAQPMAFVSLTLLVYVLFSINSQQSQRMKSKASIGGNRDCSNTSSCLSEWQP